VLVVDGGGDLNIWTRDNGCCGDEKMDVEVKDQGCYGGVKEDGGVAEDMKRDLRDLDLNEWAGKE
jgi:arsenite methyltransferase